jgi:hypothetical protein
VIKNDLICCGAGSASVCGGGGGWLMAPQVNRPLNPHPSACTHTLTNTLGGIPVAAGAASSYILAKSDTLVGTFYVPNGDKVVPHVRGREQHSKRKTAAWKQLFEIILAPFGHARWIVFAPFVSFNGVFTFSATFCYGMSTTLHFWVFIAFQLLMQEFILIHSSL